MKVLLKRNWFNPKGYRMRVDGKGTEHEMPDEWKDFLPSSAIILDDDETAPVMPPLKSQPDTFSAMNKLQYPSDAKAEDLKGNTGTDYTLEVAKKEQAKRNRQAGAARAREAKLSKEETNVEMD